MAKLVKTIKQYEEVCSQCGDSFITYKPKEERMCYRCNEQQNAVKHNKELSRLHRDLLGKNVTVLSLGVLTCRNRNFFNSIQLMDENKNIYVFDITRESDHGDDEFVFDVRVRRGDK